VKVKVDGSPAVVQLYPSNYIYAIDLLFVHKSQFAFSFAFVEPSKAVLVYEF
jgi:hypothetical protein